ncbi:hypothetical protein [Haemophilus haemolyticus]|uniref:hypothetical protein n=1 Tax=Haemophilus haemolyticus TaxID=726 RepID=UPI0018641C45|nr:hypothetical protein [Haemophilus haemolyticus]
MKTYKISAYRTVNGTDYRYQSVKFSGYSKREAIRLYRERFNLKGVKLDLFVEPSVIY